MISDVHDGAFSDVNCVSVDASMVSACVFPSPSLSEHPLTVIEFRERVVDVRYPSDAEMYTAPPVPLGAVQFVKEHPLPNAMEDPLPSVALKTAPLPALNVTLSTSTEVNDRLVPGAAVMSEEVREMGLFDVEGLGVISIEVRVSDPAEREKSVSCNGVSVRRKEMRVK